MTDPDADRRAELIAAAVANELGEDEQSELESLVEADPTVAAEIDELRGVVEGMKLSAGTWTELAPSADLRARVAGIGHAEAGERPPEPPRRRRSAWLALGAAACIALGAGVVLGTQAIEAIAPSGPPGTLGAVEQIDFGGEPSGVAVEGSLVAHTWGTETILEIDGLPAGESYAVVLIDDDGDELPSGTFLGSEVTVLCRMNGAFMRPDVAAVEIRDEAGAAVATAQLPDATAS